MRVGPAPLHEGLWDRCAPLGYALAAATILTPLLIWIKYGWPPSLGPTGWIFIWCALFCLMMLNVIWPYVTSRLWLDLLVVVVVAIGIVALVARFALPLATAVGLLPPTPVIP